jgi:hypothetical protein
LQNVAVADLSEEEKTVTKSSSGNRSWKRSTEQPTNLTWFINFGNTLDYG